MAKVEEFPQFLGATDSSSQEPSSPRSMEARYPRESYVLRVARYLRGPFPSGSGAIVPVTWPATLYRTAGVKARSVCRASVTIGVRRSVTATIRVVRFEVFIARTL